MLRLLLAMQRQCFQARSDHQFQVPFGENRVRILPVEHFALLGDANVPGETSWRLREDCGVGGATTASHGSAAPMKEAKLHSIFLRRAMQLAMCFVQFPRAGEHAAVFVGVGVAEHDFLPASPGIEQSLIFRMAPQAAHDGGGSAE